MGAELDPLVEHEEELEISTPDQAQEEELPLDANRAAKEAARRTQNDLRAAKRGIAQVVKYVEEHRDDYLKVELPPQYKDILTRDEYYYDLKGCFDIIQRYERQGFASNVSVVNDDLIKLHGHLTRLATIVGYFGGVATQADSAHKVSQAGAYIVAKDARQGIGESVTDMDADKISRRVLSHAENDARRVNIVAMVIKNAYYSIQRFADQLEKIAQRMHRQEARDAASR